MKLPVISIKRDILIRASVLFAKEKNGILGVIKSIDSDKIMEIPLPKPMDSLVRANIKKAYDYFYYIDENTTGYK